MIQSMYHDSISLVACVEPLVGFHPETGMTFITHHQVMIGGRRNFVALKHTST